MSAFVGVGIDVVDIGRFEESITRTPGMVAKLFTPDEAALPTSSLAARFAAKEAIAKALGAPGGLEWHDAEVVRDDSGQPRFVVRGTVAARLAELGGIDISLSLSHDAGIAAAIVIVS